MDEWQMLQILGTELLPKIYGFCRMKLNSEQDAQDLAQDICLELVRAIHSGKQIENFNAFAWGCPAINFFTGSAEKNMALRLI